MRKVSDQYFWLGVIVVWLAAFAAFANSFSIAFQFDDTHTVQMNLYVRSLKYVPQYFVDAKTFSYRPENSGYRPMTTTALALGFAISQGKTWGYHLIKLIEHCLVATLIMAVGLRLLPRSGAAAKLSEHARLLMAFFAALIFAVHRANTETVDYISAISTLQAGLFLLLGFYLYLKSTEVEAGAGDAKRRLAWRALSVLSYLASMLSKEEGITLVGMIFFYELVFRREDRQTHLARLRANVGRWAIMLAPYVAVAVLFLVCRASFQPAEADASRGNVPTFSYFITQFRSWLHYWNLFFWPAELNADNLAFDFSTTLADRRVLAALAVHLAIWGAAWRWRKNGRFALFAVIWLYVTVSPASSVFPLVEAVNEHRMYVPYMLLALLSVWGVFSLAARLGPKAGLRAAIGVLTAASLALGIGAYARNEVWQTDVSLWEDVYGKNPDSPRAMNVLGVSLLNSGQIERGTSLLARCHSVSPGYLPCIVHLSMGLAHLKRYEEGLKALQYAHSLDPNYPHVNYHLGLYYKDHFGDFSSARRHFERVVTVTEGRFFPATVKLAEMAAAEGRIAEAVTLTNRLLHLDASNGDAAEAQAKAMLMNGDLKQARAVFARLLTHAPGEPRFMLNVANAAERLGELKEARDHFGRAATQSPSAVQAWQGLARVAERLGDKQIARAAAGKIDELKSSGKWIFISGLLLVGESPRAFKPEW